MFSSKFIRSFSPRNTITLRVGSLTSKRNNSNKECVKEATCPKSGCFQGYPLDDCCSMVKCGPCAKYKYMDIRCKVAIVTGGACGIGFAIANELLCQEAYRVVIADKCKEHGTNAAKQLGCVYGENRACFFPLDVNSQEDFINVFKTAHEQFGGVDILVNNAATVRDLAWESTIDTNMKSVLRGTLLGFDWMKKEKKTMSGGVVVNVASVNGLDPDKSSPVLTASKYGVVGLTKALGTPIHYKKTGVRVLGICPGPTVSSQLVDEKEMSAALKQSYYDKNVPHQRPEKVANAVNYIIRYGPNGTIWAVEDSKLYRAYIPTRNTYSDPTEYVDRYSSSFYN